jgi:hypothetical protein
VESTENTKAPGMSLALLLIYSLTIWTAMYDEIALSLLTNHERMK